MIRGTGLASLRGASDRQLDRWIRRLVLLLVLGAVAFAAFYLVDRWRPASPSIVDRELVALEQAVRDDPTSVAARGRLADVYVAAGRFEDAILQYDAVLLTGKADRLAHSGRARARASVGQLDGAAEDYRAVVELSKGGEMANVDPLLQAAYYGLGDIALEQGRPADAVEHLTAALRIKRSDADALNLIGAAYLGVGDTKGAIEALRRATAFVPVGWADPYLTLEQAYVAAGQPAQAEWAGAMAALAAGDPATAETRLLAIGDGPAAVDASVGLGLVRESRGDLAGAAESYRRALALEPDNVAARLGLARAGGTTPETAPSEVPKASTPPDLPAPGMEGGPG